MTDQTNTPDDDQFISLAAAAELLGCSTKMLREAISRGQLPAYKLGTKMLRLRRGDVLAFAKPVRTIA